jgi:hypothetical protein
MPKRIRTPDSLGKLSGDIWDNMGNFGILPESFGLVKAFFGKSLWDFYIGNNAWNAIYTFL